MKSNEQHVDALQQSKTKQILEALKRLTHSEKLQRIDEAVNLLQQLKDIGTSDENQVWADVFFVSSSYEINCVAFKNKFRLSFCQI